MLVDTVVGTSWMARMCSMVWAVEEMTMIGTMVGRMNLKMAMAMGDSMSTLVG